MIELTCDGTTEARGRNGWFQLREVWINCYPDLQSIEGQAVSIAMYSKQHGEFAPIYLKVYHAEELRTLICGLAKALAQMTQTEETVHEQA